MVQGYPEKVVEVQVDGAPVIGHEEQSSAIDQPQPVSPGRMIIRFVFGLRFVSAMACICPKRI